MVVHKENILHHQLILIKKFVQVFLIYFKSDSNIMCSSLSCRASEQDENCIKINGYGAAEGSTCDSGKVLLSLYFFAI